MANTKAQTQRSMSDEYIEMWAFWALMWMIEFRMNGIDKP